MRPKRIEISLNANVQLNELATIVAKQNLNTQAEFFNIWIEELAKYSYKDRFTSLSLIWDNMNEYIKEVFENAIRKEQEEVERLIPNIVN